MKFFDVLQIKIVTDSKNKDEENDFFFWYIKKMRIFFHRCKLLSIFQGKM